MVTAVVGMAWGGTAADAQENSTLTSIPGLLVGHHTLDERPTGCTVMVTPGGAVAAVEVRGGAPGTRETDLLDPRNTVQRVHAIVLSGGSAFGLSAADGTVRYLEEQGIGYPVGALRVPIVPSAILYDLSVGDDPSVRPDAACGYTAAAAATGDPVARGSIGAGAGATVGKLRGMSAAMKGGVGSAAIALPDGSIVAALVVVNALGDIIDPRTGEIVAGTRNATGGFGDARRLTREGRLGAGSSPSNTTIGIVATNVELTRSELGRMARMAHDGLARTIVPVHTPFDGDVVFAVSTGETRGGADLLTLGALAAEVLADAVLDAVRTADGLPGFPSVRDLARE